MIIRAILGHYTIHNIDFVKFIFHKSDSTTEDLKFYKAKTYVMATGVDSYKIGKQVGITLPVYPMRGNLVTIPINVSS